MEDVLVLPVKKLHGNQFMGQSLCLCILKGITIKQKSRAVFGTRQSFWALQVNYTEQAMRFIKVNREALSRYLVDGNDNGMTQDSF